jgi:hypothetical protein
MFIAIGSMFFYFLEDLNYFGHWQENNYDYILFPQVVTTTTRSLRRPTGALYNANRVRQRSTTTTTTTTTTETPAASAESDQQRRQPGARLVRRRKYGSLSNRTRDSDATASDVQPSDSSNIASTEKGSLFKGTVLSTEIIRHRVTLQKIHYTRKL